MSTNEEQVPVSEFQKANNVWLISPTSEHATAKELKLNPCSALDFSETTKAEEQEPRAPSFSGSMTEPLMKSMTEKLLVPAPPAPVSASTAVGTDYTPTLVAELSMPSEEPKTPPSCALIHDFEENMGDPSVNASISLSSSSPKEEPLSMASVFKSISEFKQQNLKDFDFSLPKDIKFGSNTSKSTTGTSELTSSTSHISGTCNTFTLAETFSFSDMSGWKEKMKNIGNTNTSTNTTPPNNNTTFSIDNISANNTKNPFGSLSWIPKSLTSPAKSTENNSTTGCTESYAKKNIHCPNSKRLIQNPSVKGSPYGELLVVEVLGAKDLAVGDFFQGESDPYVNVYFKGVERKTEVVKGTVNPVYNQRFAFWCQQAPDEHNDLVSITFLNKNLVLADELLGEIHFTLDIPLNETCEGWFPLMKETGEYKGKVRIGMRRMVIASPAALLVAQSLSSNERSINDIDLAKHGSTVPELWYGFSNAEEPLEKVKTADVLAKKITEFSRRFMGKEETTIDGLRRNVF
jgi:hypothetical protein